MKKATIWVVLSLMLLAPVVMASPVGVGAFAGTLYPIVQDDQGNGAAYGLKLRLRLSNLFTAEPNLTFGSYGDAEIAGIGMRDGSSIKHYGLDLVFGDKLATVGLKPYFFIGGAVYNTKRDGDATTNKSGWSFGPGVAVGLMTFLDVDIRGRFNIVASEGSATKKSVGVAVGATYYFGAY